MSMHYFSCSGGTGAVSIKSKLRHVTVHVSYAASQAHGIVNVALHRVTLQVRYLYFPKGGRIFIMSKTNTGCNANEYY
jgi:hypothetical protein